MRLYPFGLFFSLLFSQPVWAEDNDQDGYDSIASGGEDCDDDDPDVNPGEAEFCD